MRIIISEKMKTISFLASYRLFQMGFVAYRLSRVVVVVIVGKLNRYLRIWKGRHRKSILESEAESCRWSKHLPQEIIELILQQLCLRDYLLFGTVCSSWQSAVAVAIAEKCCAPAPDLPLLMFCAYPYTNRDHCFLRLFNNRVFAPDEPKLYRRNITGCVEGWLIISDSFAWRPEGFIDFWSPTSSFFGFDKVKNFFFNPVSRAQIMLPSQSTIPCSESSKIVFFQKVVVSALPTSPDCIVAALCLHGELAFCRPSDKLWTLIKKDERWCFRDIMFHEGKLYAVTFQAMDFVVVFDLQDSSPGSKSKLLVMLHPRPVISSSSRREGQTVYFYDVPTFHLVKDYASNELLMILATADSAREDDYWVYPLFTDYIVPPRIKGFQVYKLDQNGPRWVHVETLGDRILFLGRRNYKIISVGEAQEELRGNCIYFAFDYNCIASPLLGREVGVYFLEDRSIKRHLPIVSRSWVGFPPIWFTPKIHGS